MKLAKVQNWLDAQGYKYIFNGDAQTEINGFSSLANYRAGSLTWIKNEENYNSLNRSKNIACAVVQSGVVIDLENAIIADHSKEIFFAILHEFWGKKQERSAVGKGTVIIGGAEIEPSVTIGCNCSIDGNVKIGMHTVIEHNVVIQGNVRIGRNCYIHSGAVIGTDGFGYYTEDNGIVKKVEHFGGVEIGDDVEIGGNTCIDRGTIDNTTIGDGSKIDNLVHIAHNVQIGRFVCVVAGTVVCGSAKLHDKAYVAPGGIIKNQLEVGENGFVGLGAVVTRNVENKEVVVGVPAKPIRKL